MTTIFLKFQNEIISIIMNRRVWTIQFVFIIVRVPFSFSYMQTNKLNAFERNIDLDLIRFNKSAINPT